MNKDQRHKYVFYLACKFLYIGKSIAIDFIIRSFFLLIVFVGLFAIMGMDGIHSLFIWVLSFIMILDLFQTAIRLSELGE